MQQKSLRLATKRQTKILTLESARIFTEDFHSVSKSAKVKHNNEKVEPMPKKEKEQQN